MKVLFLMFTLPDLRKSFNMYTALIEQFSKSGHEVAVIAPHDTRDARTKVRSEGGVKVVRVRTLPLRHVNNIVRGIANVLLPLQYLVGIRRFFKNTQFDLIILPTPPITLGGLAQRLKRRYKARVYLVLRDIFPQNAVDLGYMRKGSLVHMYFRFKEVELYRAADRIGCMSQGNINFILAHNRFLKPDQLHILPNFQLLNKEHNVRDSSLVKKYSIEGKFVVIFGGNMGKPQQLENVINLAKQCMHYPDVVFLLLGEGGQRQRLKRLVEECQVKNVRILPSISKSEYQRLIGLCEIGLISLHQDFTIPNIPSKMLDYFNMGIPVLASIDRATDFGSLLDEAGAGLWSYASEVDAFKENFDRLYLSSELRARLGANGRKYFEANLTPDRAYKIVLESLQA